MTTEDKLKDIIQYCQDYKLELYEYVDKYEKEDFNEYMEMIYTLLQ